MRLTGTIHRLLHHLLGRHHGEADDVVAQGDESLRLFETNPLLGFGDHVGGFDARLFLDLGGDSLAIGDRLLHLGASLGFDRGQPRFVVLALAFRFCALRFCGLDLRPDGIAARVDRTE